MCKLCNELLQQTYDNIIGQLCVTLQAQAHPGWSTTRAAANSSNKPHTEKINIDETEKLRLQQSCWESLSHVRGLVGSWVDLSIVQIRAVRSTQFVTAKINTE